jgi:hypothetical protein
MAKGEPRIKTWRDDRNSTATQTDFNSRTRGDSAYRRERDGMRALARPLTFELPPTDPQALGKYDRPHLPNNKPAEHR